VRADVQFRVFVRPAIQDLCQRCCLRTTGGRVLLELEDHDYVAFSGEVGNVLGDDSPALGLGDRRNLSIVSSLESRLSYVERVVTVFLLQQRGRGGNISSA
jgi:hypothetical protein